MSSAHLSFASGSNSQHENKVTHEMAAIDDDIQRCIQIDAAFIQGMKHGWNLALAGADERFDMTLKARMNEIIEARRDLRAANKK